jgi:hypothetical protein
MQITEMINGYRDIRKRLMGQPTKQKPKPEPTPERSELTPPTPKAPPPSTSKDDFAEKLPLDDKTEQPHLIVSSDIPRVTIREIQQYVCRRWNISRVDLLSHRQRAREVFPRHVAIYLARMLTLASCPMIGRQFGGRDHTTVLHAVKKIEQRMAVDPDVAAEIASCRAMFESRTAH